MYQNIIISFNRFYKELDQSGSRTYTSVMIFILIAGVFLRLYGAIVGQGYHAFAINDEISAFSYAMSFLYADENTAYLAQPTFSGGQVPGPSWTLFWVLLYKLGSDSIPAAIVLMALFNSIAVFLTYKIARFFFTPRQSLFTMLLFAAAPWSIYYSVGMWNPLPLVVLGSAIFLLLLKITKSNDSPLVFFLVALSALVPQFHMIGIFYIPVIFFVLYLMDVRLSKKWFFAGVVAGFLLYVPYLIGDALNNWENTRDILAGEKKVKDFSFSVAKIITAPATVLSGAPGRWAGETIDELKDFGDIWFGSYIVLVVFGLYSLMIGLVYVGKFFVRFFQLLKSHHFSFKNAYRESPNEVIVGVIIFMPLILFLPSGHNYATRYTIFVLPILFLLPVFFYINIRSPRLRYFWKGNFVVMMIFNLYLVMSFFSYQEDVINGNKKFMASFDKLELIRNKLEQHAGEGVKLNIKLDEPVKKLPEINKKTIHAVIEYMSAYQNYLKPVSNNNVKNYTISLENKSGGENIIYRGGGIIITSNI